MRKSELPVNKKSIRHLSRRVKSATAAALGEAAHKAARREILTTPKPGLVDAMGSGCHKDMTHETLLASAMALSPFWQLQAQVGLDGTPPQDAFPKLRAAGIKMDAAMFSATGGINAHKGLIYCMSLLLYGAGFAIYGKTPLTADAVAGFAADSARGSVENELLPLKQRDTGKTLTNGERLFLRYGVTGIRGEAEHAFPSITEAGLPALLDALKNGADINDAAICALLAIMEVNEDSNVIHRGGFDFWKDEYKKITREARRKFRPGSGDYSPIEYLEKKFTPIGVSPGGAADLLACTLFLHSTIFPAC